MKIFEGNPDKSDLDLQMGCYRGKSNSHKAVLNRLRNIERFVAAQQVLGRNPWTLNLVTHQWRWNYVVATLVLQQIYGIKASTP